MVTVDDHVLITLEPLHLKWAEIIARKRQDAAVQRNRPAHNGAPVEDAHALSIHLTGVRCEVAAKLYLNPVMWHAFEQDLCGLADLEDWIDVKGRTKAWHNLIVQKDDDDTWAYLLVISDGHPQYKLVGWCWGREAKKQRYWGDPAGGRPAYFVRQDDPILKPPRDLLCELRNRQCPIDV